MSWTLAQSLKQLQRQVDILAPKRSKASDGTIGDAAHSSRTSDHNPDGGGIVRALDITHDPRNGMDCEALYQALVASKDSRIKYIIWDRTITSGTNQKQKAWARRPYKGSNGHTKHLHVSVKSGASGNDGRAWVLNMQAKPNLEAPKVSPLLKRGSRGEAVKELQRILGLNADGVFGKGTHDAVVAFQKANGLHADGKVGPYTWDALRKGAAPAPAPKPKPVAKPAQEVKPEPTVVVAPATPKEAPVTLSSSDGISKDELKQIQQMLLDRGYTEVGGVDGEPGKLTCAAVLAFRSEHDLPLTTEIDDQFILALTKAGPRKLDRAKTTETEVATKVPEARVSWWSKVVGYVTAAGAAVVGAFKSTLDSLGVAKEYLDPVQEFAADIPASVWILIVVIVAAGIGFAGQYALRKSTEAFQTGARR